jgi:hypothetical protein
MLRTGQGNDASTCRYDGARTEMVAVVAIAVPGPCVAEVRVCQQVGLCTLTVCGFGLRGGGLLIVTAVAYRSPRHLERQQNHQENEKPAFHVAIIPNTQQSQGSCQDPER